ncbi:hypothetical protein LOTGIDRAFT_165503 [Lottia gigantea]|uniref:Uncharacterized protein n=1 Tax=Lottia gigantea TaxID=225164 RepID=V4BIZ7_LOTGI|nr:hypothetical protein LOTGIDRAFT_165503 [Lottia gigantea]ESO88719.1 hypothetical protein LOTGIDRAFT_165503 [Lottia gigantea]
MSSDWNNILKRNKEYIKAKNKIKTQVENNRLQQLRLTENLQTLFQPILKSQEDIKRKLEYKPSIEPLAPIEQPKAIEYSGVIIMTLSDIKRLFSNPDPDLPKSISPIVDDDVIPDEEESDDYAEDYSPIIQEIDEFEDMVSGGGITFLSDNNEELLNRLRVILAAMKEGHRSHRQYNEVNCILKRLLEKVIIDKNDYKSVIKNVK